MAGLILMIIAMGVILFFKSLGKKKERWPGEHRMQAQFNQAALFWNAADVRVRVKLLKTMDNENDPQVFQAYLQARWSSLPYELQLKLMGAVVVYRDNPEFFEDGQSIAAEQRGTWHVSEGKENARSAAPVNTAMQLLKQDQTYEHTGTMVRAVPELARQLMLSAHEESMKLHNAPSWYAECVLDFELTGVFHRALAFCEDAALASLFVDALLFEATRQEPTVPQDLDVMSSLTHLYRGIGKYVIAKTTLQLPPSVIPLWVFGTEYAAAVGSPLNTIRVLEIRSAAIEIRESAFSKTSSALVQDVVVPGAEYVKPTLFPGADYLIRPGMCQPSKFKDQPEEYKDLVLASLRAVAEGKLAEKQLAAAKIVQQELQKPQI